MTKQCVHLNAGAVFLRCALGFFFLRELVVWQWVRRLRFRGGAGIRLLVFLFHKWATPRSLIYALVFAALATILLDLWVRLVLAPLVRSWHAPRTDGSAGLFHLSPNERVVGSSPTRRKSGWIWQAGTLVGTNLRVWFFPRAHDAEIWSHPVASTGVARLEPAPRVAWGYIAGWPDRIAMMDGDGVSEVFAVADPEAVLSWFPPATVPGRTLGHEGGYDAC